MTKKSSVRAVLRDLTVRRQAAIWPSSGEFHQWLRTACPDCEREIELIVAAIHHEIVSEMRRLGKSLPPSILMPKLVRWLMRQTTLNNHEASWAVLSWAMALRLVPYVEEHLL